MSPIITDEELTILNQAKATKAAQSSGARKANAKRTKAEYSRAAKRAWKTKRNQHSKTKRETVDRSS